MQTPANEGSHGHDPQSHGSHPDTIGIDAASIDPSIRPEDDLFGFVNGGWIANVSIPADRSRYGAFDMLVEASQEAVRSIADTAASKQHSAIDTPQARVGTLYRSFFDTDRVEQLAWDPLAGRFAAIAAIDNIASFVTALADLERDGMPGLFGLYVSADAGSPDREIAYLTQSGLGLPDRDYYLDDDPTMRDAYLQHLTKIFDLALPALAGSGLDLGDEPAERVLALETQIAAGHWDRIDSRDAIKTYNKKSLDELAQATPGFDWTTWATGIGAPHEALAEVVVVQPSAIEATTTLLAEADLDDWKAWIVARLICFAAPYLHSEIDEANFEFFGRTISGTPEQQPRWKRGVSLINALLGDDVGQLYVAEHYPTRAAERMDTLLAHVVEAFRHRIEHLSWMGPNTRSEALNKLNNFRSKVGAPSRWRDYENYELHDDDLFGNVTRGHRVETDRQLAKIGRPVDRDEWLMTPQTVNAYYHPLLNEIVFPAAILQPPFFDAEAPDAVNYGGIGAVIAHEIGHGFDDQGSRFDGSGALRDWWTAADRSAFETRANRLIEQFDQLSCRTVPDQHVNGALTVGENIGDLCGVELAFAALGLAQRDGSAETYRLLNRTITAEQLFFLSWAQLWRTVIRPEEAKRLLMIDPHSPADLRANIVRNVDAFQRAFSTTPEDEMWLDPQQRVRVF